MKSNDVFTVPECDLRSVSVQLHTHVEGLCTPDANISLQKNKTKQCRFYFSDRG